MSNKEYLSVKNCACCHIRLDKVKKSEIQAVGSEDLLDKLNAARCAILVKKNKPIDDNVVQRGDLTCKSCVTLANRFKIPTLTKQRKYLQLSRYHRTSREDDQANTSRDANAPTRNQRTNVNTKAKTSTNVQISASFLS